MAISSYDQKIIEEIARHITSPSAVQMVLSGAGKPLEKILDAASKLPVFKKLPELVSRGVQEGLAATIFAAKITYSEKSIIREFAQLGETITDAGQIRGLSLEVKDKVADRFDLSNAFLVGTEGAVLGAATSLCEFVPFAQLAIPALISADVVASMTLLSRHASQVAFSYGFSASDPVHRAHIITSMAPQTASQDEGFMTAKVAAIAELQKLSRVVAHSSEKALREMMVRGEVPALLKLINHVAARMEIVISEKMLGMLVPFVGAAINGGVNIAFQQVGHTACKDYFRRLILSERYGEERVTREIAQAVSRIRGS